MALADSGGVNVWLEFPGDTRNHFIDGLSWALMLAGWQLSSRDHASVGSTFTVAPSDGTTILAGSKTYTFKPTLVQTIPNEVQIGVSTAASLSNLCAAINGGAGRGTAYSNKTLPNTLVSAASSGSDITLTAVQPGPEGNGLPSQFGPLVGGGFDLTAVSPQKTASNPSVPLKAGLRVYDEQTVDSFGVKYAKANTHSVVSGAAGAARLMRVTAGRRYQVVANRCQFFLFVPGTVSDDDGSVLAGGIPWVPPGSSCSGEVTNLPADDVFWDASDQGGSLTARSYGPAGDQSSSFGFFKTSVGSFNGAVVAGGGLEPGNFCHVSLSSSDDFENNLASGELILSRPRLSSGSPLLLEPFVAWGVGADNTTQPVLQGQLYDAWYGTGPWQKDSVQYFKGSYWLSLSSAALFGTLWLRVPPSPTQFEDTQVSYAH